MFHTSPTKIEAITEGRFGSFLFFAADPYVMTAGEAHLYQIDSDSLSMIEASMIFHADDCDKLNNIVADVCERYAVDSDVAMGLIDGSEQIQDYIEDFSDASFDLQHTTAVCAKELGYDGVYVEDETGTAAMIDMTGRKLQYVKKLV